MASPQTPPLLIVTTRATSALTALTRGPRRRIQRRTCSASPPRSTSICPDSLALKSITAYRELESDFARDGDHSPHRIAQFEDTLDQEQFTQELQLIGTHDRLDWILGLYYFSEEGDNVNTLDFTVSNFRSGGAFDNTAWAAFAQATFDMTDRLHLTLGGRYTDEDKAFTPDQIIYQNYYAGISNVVPPGTRWQHWMHPSCRQARGFCLCSRRKFRSLSSRPWPTSLLT